MLKKYMVGMALLTSISSMANELTVEDARKCQSNSIEIAYVSKSLEIAWDAIGTRVKQLDVEETELLIKYNTIIGSMMTVTPEMKKEYNKKVVQHNSAVNELNKWVDEVGKRQKSHTTVVIEFNARCGGKMMKKENVELVCKSPTHELDVFCRSFKLVE